MNFSIDRVSYRLTSRQSNICGTNNAMYNVETDKNPKIFRL